MMRESRGFVPILITASLSIALLIAAAGMQLGKMYAKPAPIELPQREPVKPPAYLPIQDADENGTPDWQDALVRAGLVATSSIAATTSTSSLSAASSTDPVARIGAALANSLVGGYLSLAQYDAYTPDRGEQLASNLATNFNAPAVFVPHTVDELTLDTATSRDRALRYRTDMQLALEPLISDEEYELTLYAAYVETGESMWLDRLTRAAERYRTAEQNLLALSIPQDAAPEHLRAINAIGSFAETLERMVRFAKDPLASMALLTAYNEKEREFNLAFDALVKYYARTIGDN